VKRGLTILFSWAFVIIAVFQTVPVFANVPTVTGVTAWTRQSDNHTILNITVTHGVYSPGHYVNRIQVNISGPIQTINMTNSSPADQAASSIFVVPYDMGVVLDTPAVQSQANCIIHGPSTWSTTLTVPEFSSLQLLLGLVVLAVSPVLLRFRNKKTQLKTFASSHASNQHA
jgi:hypothetical protein